jgi:hypothetical protein
LGARQRQRRYSAEDVKDLYIARREDGALSSTAGTRLSDVASLGDGTFLVVGFTWNGSNDDFALVRYNADGRPGRGVKRERMAGNRT